MGNRPFDIMRLYSNFDKFTNELIIKYLAKIKKYPLLKSNINNNLFVDKDNKSLSRNNKSNLFSILSDNKNFW